MNRKFISIVILAVLVIDAGGLIFGLQVRQWIHKASVAAIINTRQSPESILSIRMSKSEFDRVKIHEREFKYNDQMYDVVWRETDQDHYILYCYRDTAEEKMAAKFLGFLANKTKDNSPAAIQFLQSAVNGFVLFSPESAFSLSDVTMTGIQEQSSDWEIITRRPKIELPPPRFPFL